MTFKPRPGQREVLRFRKGRMGVSAVPGSGKTQTLSALAAELIASGGMQEDQEVLIVTLVNSAVNNFSRRIEGFIREHRLIPDMGYRVRTLHGLAHDIVRERPDLVGLSDQFSIVDERDADLMLTSVAEAWLNAHPEFVENNISPEITAYHASGLKKKWIELVKTIGSSFIRTAKDLQATPLDVRERLAECGLPDPLLQMGCDLYFDYQRSLNYRSAVDFDDLIRLALQAIHTDPEYLARLQYRWPYILEDEAQDSSRLQECILRALVGETGNWVRVGDPNQAIFETFTTASPHFLRNFMLEPGVLTPKLDTSGRSAPSIIDLANQLIRWTNRSHPVPHLRDALVEPFIRPTAKDDPQPNPPDLESSIFIRRKPISPEQEITEVVNSLTRWLPGHPDRTVAVLVPRNERGSQIVDALKARNIEVVELLRSSADTRHATDLLSTILRALAEPANTARLTGVFRLITAEADSPEIREAAQSAATLLRRCERLEEYLYPLPGNDWLEDQVRKAAAPPNSLALLADFRDRIRTWQAAALLPIDQLLLTLAQDLFTDPADLALAHKLALLLERTAINHPDWQLPDFSLELEAISRNERKFIGFSSDDTGFDPDQHRGKVVVATMHKAKGLEWDRVYLLSVNNYDFPSAQPYDSYQSERYFVRDHLNLEAEAVQRLKAVLTHDSAGIYAEEGAATRAARLDYCAERLRLLYVGITRAKQELIITANTGQRGDSLAALPLVELQAYWEKHHAAAN